MLFYCTVFSSAVWKLCSRSSAAKSDGEERLVWDFQKSITGMLSC